MEEIPKKDAALDGELLMEEDGEWRVALKAALAPRPPRRGRREFRRRAGKGLPSLSTGRRQPRGARRSRGWHRGGGQQSPRGKGPPLKGLPPGKSLTALAACEARKRTRSRWWRCSRGA